MIKSITVVNYHGESLKLTLPNPLLSGLVVTSMSGLGPSKANINSTELATSDGALFNSSRIVSRNITMSLKFLENPTIEDSRQKSYKYFPVKKPLMLIIETDNRTSYIYGYVESNEADIFSKQAGTTISIICPDPYFYSYGVTEKQVTVFAGIIDNFEFPFYNDSLVDDLLVFGEISLLKSQNILYKGDADIGINIYLHAIGEVTNVVLYNSLTNEVMRIDTDKLETFTGYPIIASDDIVISTMVGNKSITLIRDGLSINILNCLNRDADWFRLSYGDNVFAFDAETGAENIQLRIENQIRYEGV